MTLLLSASLVNCFLITTFSLTGLLRWENLLLFSGFISHTKFHTKLRDSQYLLSDALLYVFPVKNISNANSRFPILYSTNLIYLLCHFNRIYYSYYVYTLNRISLPICTLISITSKITYLSKCSSKFWQVCLIESYENKLKFQLFYCNLLGFLLGSCTVRQSVYSGESKGIECIEGIKVSKGINPNYHVCIVCIEYNTLIKLISLEKIVTRTITKYRMAAFLGRLPLNFENVTGVYLILSPSLTRTIIKYRMAAFWVGSPLTSKT
jgi:hypothetical protein